MDGVAPSTSLFRYSNPTLPKYLADPGRDPSLRAARLEGPQQKPTPFWRVVHERHFAP